ncbi:helix-turn-helix transcriptional regulator [Limibacter armeniacum]|uniref:helix-turn-helix domain-containing protein n=1 Tax=Limibacter armeniacum TaxID=466084 RepID=UPI002FE50101
MSPKNTNSSLAERAASKPFNIQQMQTIFQAASNKKDVPHRHAYYTVLLIREAVGKHVVDYKTYPMASSQVHFISPGQVHQVDLTDEPDGWVITFSKEFLIENNIPESFISNINLFRSFGETPPLAVDAKTFGKLEKVVLDMLECVEGEIHYSSQAMGALLQLFLIYCNNSCTLDASSHDTQDTGICMLRDFKRMVDQHYFEWHKVTDYAEAMFVTTKHLSYSLKETSGKTAKQLIQDRITLEAKRLLLHSDQSIKELSLTLGFEEPLHFSGFFKKMAGVSPTEYRERK